MTLKVNRLADRIRSLTTRHGEIDRRIQDEMARPMPDTLRLQTLKRMRLKSKDQIKMIVRMLRGGDGPGRPSAA